MKKILVVDDEPEICSSIKEYLEDLYEVLFAADGEEALQVVRKQKPDVILTDVMMPKMSGFSFYKNLRKIKSEVGEIPLIVMSGRPSMQEHFDAWAIVTFLNKPFKGGELLAVIERALAEAAQYVPMNDLVSDSKEASLSPLPQESARMQKKYRAILASEDESVLSWLEKYFTEKGYVVDIGRNEDDIVDIALARKPGIIICHWDNPEVFDVRKVHEKLNILEVSRKIPFVVICESVLAAQAEQVIAEDKIITFNSLKELRAKLDRYL